MIARSIRTIIFATMAPILFVACLPFALTSCAIFETLRPSITAAGHVLLDGLDELLTTFESAPPGGMLQQELTSDIIVKLEICAETVPKRYLEPYRLRFRAATRREADPPPPTTTDPG